jgi:3-hydroxybutyryl-CoA dehydratase
MAQAEAFETDFWKDANLRKVWDDIVPGEPRKTIPYTLTERSHRVVLQIGRRGSSDLF